MVFKACNESIQVSTIDYVGCILICSRLILPFYILHSESKEEKMDFEVISKIKDLIDKSWSSTIEARNVKNACLFVSLLFQPILLSRNYMEKILKEVRLKLNPF